MPGQEPIDAVTTVRALLAQHGLQVSDEELDGFVRSYPRVREAADRLYLPEVQYEEPALQFTPDWDQTA